MQVDELAVRSSAHLTETPDVTNIYNEHPISPCPVSPSTRVYGSARLDPMNRLLTPLRLAPPRACAALVHATTPASAELSLAAASSSAAPAASAPAAAPSSASALLSALLPALTAAWTLPGLIPSLLLTGKGKRSGKSKRHPKAANHGARPCNHVGRKQRAAALGNVRFQPKR